MAELIPFYAGVEDRLYSDSCNAGGANDHIFARVNFRNGNVDEFLSGSFGHQLGAVPLLEVLNGGETNFFCVPTIEGHVDDVFVGSSGHGFNGLDDQILDDQISIG